MLDKNALSASELRPLDASVIDFGVCGQAAIDPKVQIAPPILGFDDDRVEVDWDAVELSELFPFGMSLMRNERLDNEIS